MDIEVIEIVSEKEQDKWGPINVEQVSSSFYCELDLIER